MADGGNDCAVFCFKGAGRWDLGLLILLRREGRGVRGMISRMRNQNWLRERLRCSEQVNVNRGCTLQSWSQVITPKPTEIDFTEKQATTVFVR